MYFIVPLHLQGFIKGFVISLSSHKQILQQEEDLFFDLSNLYCYLFWLMILLFVLSPTMLMFPGYDGSSLLSKSVLFFFGEFDLLINTSRTVMWTLPNLTVSPSFILKLFLNHILTFFMLVKLCLNTSHAVSSKYLKLYFLSAMSLSNKSEKLESL